MKIGNCFGYLICDGIPTFTLGPHCNNEYNFRLIVFSYIYCFYIIWTMGPLCLNFSRKIFLFYF